MGVGDRAYDREPEPRPGAGAGARRLGTMEAVEDELALLDGNARAVVLDDEADAVAGSALDAHTHQSALLVCVVDRVCNEVAQGLGEAIGIGAEDARRHDTQLKAARREQAHPVPQLGHVGAEIDRFAAQELRLLALGEQQQVIDQAADPGDLSPREALDAANLRGGRCFLGGQHFELAANHGQRRAKLVRGVGEECSLSRERLGETVQHVVEGVGQHLQLVSLGAHVVDAGVQVAGVHARGHGGHPAQRSRHTVADQV